MGPDIGTIGLHYRRQMSALVRWGTGVTGIDIGAA
jgi:hypothetical protein